MTLASYWSPETLILASHWLDLPVLANMLSTLFQATSTSLSDDSLNHLIEALIKINGESLALAMNNKEPSLFAVAKLLETGSVNMGRVEAWWVR